MRIYGWAFSLFPPTQHNATKFPYSHATKIAAQSKNANVVVVVVVPFCGIYEKNYHFSQ